MTGLSIRALGPDDVDFGLRLSSSVNWNQLRADWLRVLALEPHGSFVAVLDGVDVGTCASVRFGAVAWIGLMLVDPAARGQGVGKALMQHTLRWLDERGVQSVRLDATPLGQPLYEKLDFAVDFQLDRWAGVPRGTMPADVACIEQLTTADRVEVERLDRLATDTDRRAFLAHLHAELPEAAHVVRRAGRLTGCMLARNGRSARQLGPCTALDDSGATLLTAALAEQAALQQSVYVDIPRTHVAARQIAERFGLQPQRVLTRMTRGPKVAERSELIWASSGPEKG